MNKYIKLSFFYSIFFISFYLSAEENTALNKSNNNNMKQFENVSNKNKIDQKQTIPNNKINGSSLTDEYEKENSKIKEFNFKDAFLNMIFALLFIVFFILVAGWIFKRLIKIKTTQTNLGSNIKIIERRTLSSKSCIYIVNIQNKNIVIGESQNSLHNLGEVDIDLTNDENKEQLPKKSFFNIFQNKKNCLK
jgi:flagellar biogenesis protein FliO